MKARDILKWIVDESINGELLNVLDVPEEGEEEWEQNEGWWLAVMGGVPPRPALPGKYLYYHTGNIPTMDICIEDEQQNLMVHNPDVTIELSDINGFSYVLMYKIDK